jgi:serine/threonine-protein kinase
MQTVKLQRAAWQFDPTVRLGERGGFGEVFIGRSEAGEQVAVKRLFIPADGTAHRELLIANELAGRNLSFVIPVLDAGLDAETDNYFIVMPQADCGLHSYLDKSGPLGEHEAIEVLRSILNGLLEVPDIVHRDLKPANVLLQEGRWKIADFGIAKFVEDATSPNTVKKALAATYAAPEQWRGERVTNSTDLYALGCIAYTLLTGHPPFLPPDVQEKHLYEQPPPLEAASPQLQALVSMLLQKEQSTRPSPQRVLEQLNQLEIEVGCERKA